MSLVCTPKFLGETSVNLNDRAPNEDKTKIWQMELLMEKLRSKAGQFKSFAESSKALRMSLLDKRHPCDNIERAQLQKCLDTLQHCIKVTSLQGMVERLESLTRQLGLKFVAGPSGFEWFISSDMFYLEVVLEPSGVVRDVKIHHEGKVEIQSCEELVSCLSRGDFGDFTAQLEGLTSIYQLNAEKKVKCKAFSALESLEADLGTLAGVQSMIKDPFNLVHKSPVGILEKRRGGHAMKLTYLVAPYDLLDMATGAAIPLSVEEVISRQMGLSALVCMEGSIAHKLPTQPLITVTRAVNGKNTPAYTGLTAANSCSLPACFVLRLPQPLPMCVGLVAKISRLTELELADCSLARPLLGLIAHTVDKSVDTRRGLFVSLPDQQHCYFMTETKGLDGVLVKSIPFTHPSHVPQILVFLRQQALLNTLIASCIRPSAKQDLEAMTMFEVRALSWLHLSISLEHPLEETLATAELDLTDIGNVKCTVHGTGLPNDASKVLQRCLSIPVTMRSLIRSWQIQPNMVTGSSVQAPPTAGGGGQSNGPEVDLSRAKQEPDRGSLGRGEGSEANFQPPPDSSSFLMLAKPPAPAAVPVTAKLPGRKRKAEWRKSTDDCEIVLESSSEDSALSTEKVCSDEEEEATRKIKKPTPAISITPALNAVLSGMGLERRPGIEIIPINSNPVAALPSSITITAINKPRPKQRSDDKARIEKRRKRRREELGLNNPVSVSIKQTDGKVSLDKSGLASGKPSMSTLKSVSSPVKTELKLKTLSSKEKERKDGTKMKSSSVKLKLLEVGEMNSMAGNQPQRNRKSSLSAIVDKLKSAQHLGPETEAKPKTPGEYMVKPSGDGMKITINKTRTKDSKMKSSSSSSSSGSGSPKVHTGLKPGVNSGPASKKPHTVLPSKSISQLSSKSSGVTLSKSGSPALGLVARKSSPKMGERRDKTRPLKPGEKPYVKGKSSPVIEIEGERAFKLLAAHAKIDSTLVVEGLIKSLDTKFQIPKLSARNQDEKKTEAKVESKAEVRTEEKKAKLAVATVSKPDEVPAAIEPREEVLPVKEADLPRILPAEPVKVVVATVGIVKPEEPRKLLLTPEFSGNKINSPSKVQSPKPPDAAEILVDFSAAPLKSDPVVPIALAHTPSPGFPLSPVATSLIGPSPHSASPCITDDELMDEALVGMGK